MGDIVLIGSSIFELWYNYDKAFPGRKARNLAIGGTTTRDWLDETLRPLLRKEKPGEIILYVGSNDILVHEEEEIKNNLLAVRNSIFTYDPRIGFAYFSIIKAPGKRGQWDKIERINSWFRDSLKRGDFFYDTDRVFFINGRLREDYFLEDLTHHPPEAYDALVDDVTGRLTDWLDQRESQRDRQNPV